MIIYAAANGYLDEVPVDKVAGVGGRSSTAIWMPAISELVQSIHDDNGRGSSKKICRRAV